MDDEKWKSELDQIRRMQARGVKLTREGNYPEAVTQLRETLERITTFAGRYPDVEIRVDRANILRDFGEALRHIPEGSTEAMKLVGQSIDLLNREDNPAEWASSMQHKARILRQWGWGPTEWDSRYLADALHHVDQAWDAAFTLDRDIPERLWIGLDYAAILALNEQPAEARHIAKYCYRLAKRMAKRDSTRAVVGIKHFVRAKTIVLFAGWTNIPLPLVRKAFWGRALVP